jgi:hypothetical protein
MKLILFDVCKHKVFLYTHHTSMWALCVARRISSPNSNASQYISTDCCDDIPDPCLQISCNIGSINLILNITPQKEV